MIIPGAFLRERLFDVGWLVEVEEKRYEITEKGLEGLESLGTDLKLLTEWRRDRTSRHRYH
jgi:DNA-binding PadR family transcriptional regulator